jgi:hypothetical protein
MEQKSHGSNSFVLGVVVGVVLTLLFTTKKGRRVLATLTDEGLSRFSDLEKAMKSMQEETAQELLDEDEEIIASSEAPEEHHNGASKKTHSIGRRFFRGTHKRG